MQKTQLSKYQRGEIKYENNKKERSKTGGTKKKHKMVKINPNISKYTKFAWTKLKDKQFQTRFLKLSVSYL